MSTEKISIEMLLSSFYHFNHAFEEEFRSQNSGVRINQSGIQTRDFLVDHQIYDLEGVLNPFIHPPVAQNSILNSGD
ncbi:hypothetical protein [Nostoc sp. ChiQUE01b]|uniref:hypothetical protein n=1 Tax=Nostoc sp. ChiQUE01b TaxID=3075376 RepID=UPI002AD31CF1|nr:hypothetical protein [Nostoc sp. ChiQUE01b]MDZ8261741.1 hypothetical protein [Nostoc sp. ChiQUE01b]